MDGRSDDNKLQMALSAGVEPNLALWTYGLQMQLGLRTAYFNFEMWHPSYGRIQADQFAIERDLGSATMPYIVSHLWCGVTELQERTDQR